MISFDSTGTQRLVYKSETFVESLTVTAYLWSPSLVKSDLQTFTEVEDGLYYLDYNFSVTGTYIGLFMEGGVNKIGGAIRIQDANNIILSKLDTAMELDAAVYRFTENALEEAPSGTGASAASIVAAILAAKGVTEGGDWTMAKAMKVITARLAGKVRLKSGTTNILEILDADDETTVIDEVTLNQTTPYRQDNIQI